MKSHSNQMMLGWGGAVLLLTGVLWLMHSGSASQVLAGTAQDQPRSGGAATTQAAAEPPTAGAELESGRPAEEGEIKMPALRFKMKDIDGKEQDLTQYHGNVVLMVNVASKCGLTPQYKELQALYAKYKDKGFVILGFPANDFLRQEPGDESQIKTFCTTNHGVTFPMFGKIKVKGREKSPLYDYLTSKKAGHEFGGAIEWNFAKFLIDRNGEIVARFGPRTKPDDKKIIKALEAALAMPVPEDSPLAAARSKQPATTQSSE